MKKRSPIKLLAPLVLGLLCVVAAFQPALALDPAKAITQYVHSVWRTDEGLPENSVTKILETSDGYLWVGTQAGVARFDGVRFTVFDHTNTPALHDDWIDDLVEDRDGTLWIATSNGGVTSFREGVFTHLDAIGERGGLALAADADGSVWIGGYGGLSHLSNGKVVKSYTTADGLSGDLVRSIVADKDGSLWIGTPGGLNRLADGKIAKFSTADGLAGKDITSVRLGTDGALWVITQNAELTHRIDGHFLPWTMQGVSGADVTDINEDRDGNLWFASSSQGLLRVNGQQVAHITAKDGLSGDQVKTLYEDREGNEWVGTTEGGLDRFRDGSFTTWATEEGLAADQTYAVTEDHAGDIWVTTGSGLNQLHANHVRVFTTADGLPGNSTWAIREDHEQNLWVGTSKSGVVRMVDGHVALVLSPQDGIPPYLVSSVVEDSARQLWISTTGGGLVRYANGHATAYSRPNGLLTNFLFALAEGAKGTLWIGTSDGLESIQDGRFTSYPGSGLAHAAVYTLYVDTRGVVWVGTLGRGLFRFENDHFTRYTTHQGLPDDSINNILEDAQANLWIGSNKGIFRITRSDLDAVAAGTSRTVEPIVFGKADGMKSSETNSGTQPAGWRARDGKLWFPTIRGVTMVDPARLSLSDKQGPARVEQMRADDVAINLAVPVRLTPGTRRLEIRYTAPNLSAPERIRFRYRLDGYDTQWIAGGSQRVAQYTNLSPGHYTFRVAARAETGSWSAQEATLGFDLNPQFYQTGWFRLLCVVVGILLMWIAYRLRVGWLHARAAVLEERQRIASEIHDSLAQGLSGIVFQAEAALMSMSRAPNMTAKHVKSALDLAKSSLDDARYSVWNLSPPIQDQKNLLESLSSMARQLAHGRVGELDIHSSGTAWSMRPEANHHVVLVAQEAISNAIQHGSAQTVVVDLTFAADALCLTVSDDGVGFVPDGAGQKPRRGYGMRNMHHRADRLGAVLIVESEVGKGTSISLRVPRLTVWARLWRGLRGNSIARIDG
jgi:ligand-binding sensor domain-containing protein/signal transduction histidine kinase